MPQDNQQGAAGGSEVSAASYCYALLWFFLLLFVAWPFAIICAVLWVLIQPCEPCIDGADEINRCLYPWLRYPRRVGRAIHRCDTEMPKPVPKPDNVGEGRPSQGARPPTEDEENGY
jgi:hypothetical protein